jgi:molybdopterin-synthase adenylyltransferase
VSLQSGPRGFGRRRLPCRAAAGPHRAGQFLGYRPDFIEDTNLNRLVGATLEDVRLGTAKVDIAERVILSVNPAAEVIKRLASWSEVTAELRDVDIIFACVDSIGCRSELESFARRFLIPLIDVGMDVHELNGEFSIGGQVMLSMPGKPCMRCMGLVTDEALAKEAAQYGAAGGKSQVVWPNGTVASIAVGFFMKLITPWETHKPSPLLLEYDGDLQTVAQSNELAYLPPYCKHFDSLNELGDPFWTANRAQSGGSCPADRLGQQPDASWRSMRPAFAGPRCAG